eukprot:570058-Pyramimonas_sp.AAC.1
MALSFTKHPKPSVKVPVGPGLESPSPDVALDCAHNGLRPMADQARGSDIQRNWKTLRAQFANPADKEIALSSRMSLCTYGARGLIPRLT